MPERVMENIQNADWTRTGANGLGGGKILFESIAEYARKKG
jgi:hypothetical protein